MMNNPRLINGIGPFPPTAPGTAGANLGNINGIGAMGGMANMGGMGGLGNMGGMGGMGGMGAAGAGGAGAGGGGGPGQIHNQQHPGQHGPPPMGLPPNHQQPPHANPPPMGGLQPTGNQPGQNQGAAGVQPGLGQQPNSLQFMANPSQNHMLQRQLEMQQQQQQQRLAAAQAAARQQQQQQQNPQQQHGGQQMQHQQGLQGQQQQPPQPGGFPGMSSHMGNFGSPRPASLMNTGTANGMGTMSGLGIGAMGGVPGANFHPGNTASAMAQQLGAIRRVPSQTGQPGQPQPPGAANAGMNMNMLGGMGVGGMGMGMTNSLAALRQGMPVVAQRFPPGSQPPSGQLAPGQRNPSGSVPPELAAVIQDSRQRDQHVQQAQGHMQPQAQQPPHLGQQPHGHPHPRTPSVVNANAAMPLSAGMNNANSATGSIPNPMNPNAMGAPGMQRTPSAQSMGAPGLAPGGMHPGHPNHPNHTNQNLSQQLPHGQQQQNPPPFVNPLHQHAMQNPQMQHQQQHQHPQLGGQQQHLGQHSQQSSGLPMSGIPGPNHVPSANAMPGGMQAHPGQQHPNAASPQRPGTGGHSQPQTPSVPASMRPQSRAGEQQQPMISFPGGGSQPQFGGQMRQQPGGHPMQLQPGQQGGPPGPPFGAQGVGMPGRVTPQQPNPMAALGNSPGSMNGRPGSSAGGPGPIVGGGAGGVGGMAGTSGMGMAGRPPFLTPAQQLEMNQRGTMGQYAGVMPPLTNQSHQGPGPGPGGGPGTGPLGAPIQRPPTGQAHPHGQPHGQPTHQPFSSSVHPGQRSNSPATHRQPTPALAQANALGRMGTPTLAQGLPQGQLNRSPSVVQTPVRQQNHPQAGATPGAGPGQGQTQQNQGGPGQGSAPTRTPRTQATQLPSTPGAASNASNAGGAGAPGGRVQPPMAPLTRPGAGVGLGINSMPGGQPNAGQQTQPQQPPSSQQQQPPNAGAQPQQQQTAAAPPGQPRPPTQDGTNPPPSAIPMVPMQYFQRPFPPGFNAIGRLLAFSDSLSHPKVPLSKDFWESLVGEYFTAKAVFKFTLWKDNAQTEAKPFDITMPILPRFFLVTAQSGVSSMSFNFEGAKERMQTPYIYTVEIPTASWTFYYSNGYIVTLRGSCSATVVIVPNPTPIPPPPTGANGATQQPPQPPGLPYVLKIEAISFDARKHEKSVRVEYIMGRRSDPVQRTPKMMMKMESSPAGSSATTTSTIASASADGGAGAGATPGFEDEKSAGGGGSSGGGGDLVVHFERATIPSEPVNAFGIPQATMRCLELAESVGLMSGLMDFSLQAGFGPKEALKNFAHMLREQGFNFQPPNQNSPGQLMDAQQTNGVVTSPAVTLYQSSPPVEHATTKPPGGLQPPPPNMQQQHRPGGPGQVQGGQGGGPGDMSSSPHMASTPASAQTPNAPPLSAGAPTSTSSTPMVAHATLKRKAGETASPTTATAESQAQPPAKRAQRKRSVRH